MSKTQSNEVCKKIFAICGFSGNRVVLDLAKSEEHKSNVFKLLQVKYNPSLHGKYNKEEMKKEVLKKFFGEKFDVKKVLAEKNFSVKKGTDFVVLYINLANVPGGINGSPSYRHIIDLDRPYKTLPTGGSKAMVLPSVVAAVRVISQLVTKK